MLLELEKPLEFGGTVAAACLNSKPIDSANDKCISVGWFLEDGMQFQLFLIFLQCLFEEKKPIR